MFQNSEHEVSGTLVAADGKLLNFNYNLFGDEMWEEGELRTSKQTNQSGMICLHPAPSSIHVQDTGAVFTTR